MKIIFISGNYPNKLNYASGTFVRQFVLAMARLGHQCIVVSPLSLFKGGDFKLTTEKYRENIDNVNIEIYRPRFLSISSRKLFFFHTGKWTQFFFTRSIKQTLSKINIKPDIIYGHFLYPSGYAATKIASIFNVPVFIGVGEDSPWTMQAYGIELAKIHFHKNSFFIPNSTKNSEMLKNLLRVDESRIFMAPNGVDLTNFRPIDKNLARMKLGFDEDWFIVSFVGTNEPRKGADRLLKAINSMNNVKCIFIGKGTESLESEKIIFKGQVSQDIIPYYINCSDVFVLPTLSEGSCNAVIEAMACGVPIITSDGFHMSDIVDDTMSIRVDASNVELIREAIYEIQCNKRKRSLMGSASLVKSLSFDVNNRAKNITAFIESILDQ
ncbi:MAG: glycosyltransferase [Sediminibacterium sp.]|uniref:glycosyltransferase n=1 Tax=Sediminibacterium sp. TaxID=1917865 RepID=UPI002ABA7DC1|nr:glycosyltransferase [Sediminibacterium sp.]MDZ4070735.1 glycosyltransferase [Sediminibacterium sp.]